MPRVEFQKVTKTFAGRNVVDQLELVISDGEYLVLLGPSGSGKTTVLRLLAGLETLTSGRILMNGRDLAGVDAAERSLALVFQNHALYPHLTAEGNLALPLRLRRISAGETQNRVEEIAALLGISTLLGRLPEELSGGERQRVALGRGLIIRPQLLLLDEPLSDLDPTLRAQLRSELRRWATVFELTVIHVTHDQREALSMGDRVAVLRSGVLQQIDSPERIYQSPATRFVAGFVGDPPMNLWRLPDGTWRGVRPENLTLEPLGPPLLTGKVVRREYTGKDSWLVVAHEHGEALVLEKSATSVPMGKVVDLFHHGSDGCHFTL